MRQHLALLGHHVRDVVTGTEGIVSSVSFDISGCVQGRVSPTKKVGEKELPQSYWFDTKRLTEIGDGQPVMDQPSFQDVPGGQDLPRHSSPPTK
jgi:hypothetical protein